MVLLSQCFPPPSLFPIYPLLPWSLKLGPQDASLITDNLLQGEHIRTTSCETRSQGGSQWGRSPGGTALTTSRKGGAGGVWVLWQYRSEAVGPGPPADGTQASMDLNLRETPATRHAPPYYKVRRFLILYAQSSVYLVHIFNSGNNCISNRS